MQRAAITVVAQIKQLTTQTIECCRSDIKYMLCFLAVLVSRPISVLFTVYCLMWIVSFVDSGVVTDDY